MLTTMNEVLKIAEARNIAVGAFDTPNLENMFAVVKTAEKYNVPVILMYIPLLEDVAPVEFMAPVMVAVARNAKVPVAVHLDHCSDLERLKRCLELGFTSVMYDGSELSYEENVRNTKIAVEYARRYGADVEAEIGIMGGREAGGANVASIKPEDMYTDPEDAKRFVEETKIDALAASFGTVHGFYTVAPKLDFARIEKIKSLVKIPTPKFVVFYNGAQKQPEKMTQYLSDSFEQKTDDPELELKCKVYNINYGKNRAIMEKCRWLDEYMMFVDKVREYHRSKDEDDLEADINKAIDYCIENDVLKEFLLERRGEVTKVMALDYTFDKQLEMERVDAWKEGRVAMSKLMNKLLYDGNIEEARRVTEDAEYCERLMKEYGII